MAVSADRVPRGGTQDIFFAVPTGSTITATIDTGAAYPRHATLLLPAERGGVQARILTGTRAAMGYRYTLPVGAFFGYGYALLSFHVPHNAPLGAVSVPAIAREPGGCAATATTRFMVVAARATRDGFARSTTATAAWAGQGADGALGGTARGVSLPATLSHTVASLSASAATGGRTPRGLAAGGATLAIGGGTHATCRDTAVSSLSVHVTTAARIRVSGAAGYMLGGVGPCDPLLYVALRGTSRATILATARVTTGVKLDRFALLGGNGLLRGSGRWTELDYVAAPGYYLLQLRLAPRNRGVRGLLALRVTALAYTQERATATARARR